MKVEIVYGNKCGRIIEETVNADRIFINRSDISIYWNEECEIILMESIVSMEVDGK